MADPIAPSASETPVATPATMEALAGLLGEAVAAGIAKHNPKKVTFGEYNRRRNLGRSILKRECFQNGYRINAENLSNEEIDLLNKLDRTGRYINRLVECVVKEEGANETVELHYNDKSVDQRFANGRAWRDFGDLLRQIVEVQAVERAEEEEKIERKAQRREFGNTKAFREARERSQAAA